MNATRARRRQGETVMQGSQKKSDEKDGYYNRLIIKMNTFFLHDDKQAAVV